MDHPEETNSFKEDFSELIADDIKILRVNKLNDRIYLVNIDDRLPNNSHRTKNSSH
jgi:hypothetical protein